MNNFPISHGLRDSPVVPLGEELVEDDRHRFLESSGTFASRLVRLVEDPDLDRQARRGLGLGDVVPHRLQRPEDDPATGSCHVREQAVLDRVVLRAIGRVVGRAYASQ